MTVWDESLDNYRRSHIGDDGDDSLLLADAGLYVEAEPYSPEDCTGAPGIINAVSVMAGQLLIAYKMNDWTDEELDVFIDKVHSLSVACDEAWVRARADRGVGIAPARLFDDDAPYAGKPLTNDTVNPDV